MNLLPKEQLIQTSSVDHADWNYRPLLAPLMKRRFKLALALLPRERSSRMLEVGFGSGVFMPELATRCCEMYGIDVHPETERVQTRLAACGVHAKLARRDAASTQFDDAFFDTIVSISALEFIEQIDDAAAELARILNPNGRLVAVMPNKSPILDFALRVVTGEDPKRDYGDRRERVLPALLRHFRVVRRKRFLPIYNAYELQPLAKAVTPARFESRAPQPESVP